VAARPRPADRRVALGIDVGLSGTRAAIVAEDGSVLSRGAAARPDRTWAPSAQPRPAPAWRQEAVEATRQAISGLVGVALSAIGVGGLGPSTVLVDAAFEVLAGPLLFTDSPRDEPVVPRADAVSTDNALPRLVELHERHPELVESASYALDTTGCLVAWLTGRPVMDDLTAVDYRLAGVDSPVRLPEASRPDAVAGSLRPAAAAELGLAAGTPVAVGTYDSYVDMFAMGLTSPGHGALLLGSSLVAGALVAEASGVEEVGLRSLPWPLAEGLLVGGWTSSAGAALDWSAGVFGPGGDGGPCPRPASGGLVFLPYLAGERTPVWDTAASGIFAGVTLETTRTQLARAVLDGVALSAKDILGRIEAVGAGPSRWRVGGGGTRHRDWLQATADATGERLEVLDTSGGVGAAILGFRSIGVEVALGPTRAVEPDAEAQQRFDRLSAVYDTLYPALAEAMLSLQQLRMEYP
jgi:xylulokinase